MAIERYVITMATDSDRYRRFRRLNAHLDCQVFDAVNGAALSVDDAIRQGYITRDCAASGLVSPGQLGCAISHWTLWWTAVYQQKTLLILEDDAATHPDLRSWIDNAEIADDVDMILFGVNTDSVLEAISPEGVHQITVFGEPYPDYGTIGHRLALTRAADVKLWRIRKALGLCCYLVTPKGAAKLTEQLLPLRLDGVPVPLVNDNMAGIGVDRRLNALFENLAAYVSVPFLAWSPNMDSATRG